MFLPLYKFWKVTLAHTDDHERTDIPDKRCTMGIYTHNTAGAMWLVVYLEDHSGLYDVPELNGIALTQSALSSEIGSAGHVFIAVAILLFAFSSIIGNYYYGEANIRFMTSSTTVLTVYRLFSGGVVVMFGALASLDTVWRVGDLLMAMLTACNLIAIITLGKYAFRLLDDYRSQKRRGIKDPVFRRSLLPEIEKELNGWE